MNTAAWVQAASTVVLTILTAIYVVKTNTMARAAKAQMDSAVKEEDRRRKAYRYTVHVAAVRLLSELKRLPERVGVGPEIRSHPGWSVSQLGDLIGYAREVFEVDEADAMEAVSALNSLNEMIARIKEVHPIHGVREKDLQIENWRADHAEACRRLERIAAATEPIGGWGGRS